MSSGVFWGFLQYLQGYDEVCRGLQESAEFSWALLGSAEVC